MKSYLYLSNDTKRKYVAHAREAAYRLTSMNMKFSEYTCPLTVDATLCNDEFLSFIWLCGNRTTAYEITGARLVSNLRMLFSKAVVYF